MVREGDTPPVSGEAPDATLEELAEYFHDGDEEQKDEMDAIVKSIGHEINCLLRLADGLEEDAAPALPTTAKGSAA